MALSWLLGLTSSLSASAASLVYNLDHNLAGEPNGRLEASTAKYWLNGTIPAGFANGDAIAFSQAGSATITVNGNVTPAATLVSSGSYTFTGSRIGGPLSVTGGFVVLQSANNFTSAQISGGFVKATHERSLGSGSLTLSGFTILDVYIGNGAGGALQVSDLTLAGGKLGLGIYNATSAGHDQVTAASSVALTAGTLTELEFKLEYDPVDFVHSFTLVQNNGTGAVTGGGLFSYQQVPLPEGAAFTVNYFSLNLGPISQQFAITYQGGSGNDVVIRAIPEPALGALAFLAAGLSGCFRWRRSRARGIGGE